jgi:hypothetical protein
MFSELLRTKHRKLKTKLKTETLIWKYETRATHAQACAANCLVLPLAVGTETNFTAEQAFWHTSDSCRSGRQTTHEGTIKAHRPHRKSLKHTRMAYFHSFLRPAFPYFPFKHQSCVCVCALDCLVYLAKETIEYAGNSVATSTCFVAYHWLPIVFILYFDGRPERDDYSLSN